MKNYFLHIKSRLLCKAQWVKNTPPRRQVAPSAWRSNGLGIFSPTIDFLTLKKKFIYNCRYNEPFLLFDKPYRVSQKKVHKAFDVWMVPPCQFGRQIAPPEGTFSVRLFGCGLDKGMGHFSFQFPKLLETSNGFFAF